MRGTFDQGEPAAAIRHAPWTPAETDVLRGRTLTSWPSPRTDTQAGGDRFGSDVGRAASVRKSEHGPSGRMVSPGWTSRSLPPTRWPGEPGHRAGRT
ncbi:DJ-1/PfpI family protein [Streptomyces sp. NPDC054961]